MPTSTQLRARAARRQWSLEPDGLIRGNGQPPIGTHEVEIYNALGPAVGPAGDPDRRRRADRGGSRDAADAHLARRHPRRPAHAHRSTPTAATPSKRWCRRRSHSATNTSRSPTTRRIRPPAAASRSTTCGARPTRSRALRERYPQIDDSPWLRSGHPAATAGSISPTRSSSASISCWRRCTSAPNHGPEQLLRRYLDAMRHPLVTIITHPTNRLVPHRAGYPLDYDRAVRRRGRNRHGRRSRRRAVAPRSRRRPRAPGDAGRRAHRRRQ